jgi:haloalkane dehalogenase
VLSWNGLIVNFFLFAIHSYISRDGLMRYVDVGSGPVMLFVHGTPTWSLLWRHAIAKFASTHRVIAIDHLGFGLSEKPSEVDYSLPAHAARFHEFVDYLKIKDITLIVHDFGCTNCIERCHKPTWFIQKISLIQYIFVAIADEFAVPTSISLLNGRVGKFLYINLNMSPQWLLPAVFANRQNLDDAVHAHTWHHLPIRPNAKHYGQLHELPKIAWLAQCWAQREHITKIPTLLLWEAEILFLGQFIYNAGNNYFIMSRFVPITMQVILSQEEASFDYVKQIQAFIT